MRHWFDRGRYHNLEEERLSARVAQEKTLDVRSIGFILVMALMGGIIAVLADRLGRKLGKSRHTLFGLRPRRTAELLTFVAGFVIPIATILIIIAVSSDFRELIVRGTRALEDAKRYEARASELQKNVDSLTGLKERTEKDLNEKNRELADARKQREAIIKKSNELQAKITSLNGSLEKLNAGVRKLTQKTSTLNAQYQQAKEDYARVKASFAAQNQQFQDISERNITLERENNKLDKDREQLSNDINNLRGKISELEKERTDLERQVADARVEYQKQLGDLNRQLKEAQDALSKAQESLNEAQSQAQFIKGISNSSRSQVMTFRIGEELARVQLGPNLTEEQARSLLNSLLRQAIMAAEARGAKSNNQYPAAVIPEVRFNDGTIASTRDQIEEMIRQMRNLPEYTFIVAIANWNAFAGEPVPINIKRFKNQVVYEANDPIGDMRIDGSQSDEEVLEQLNKFFGEVIRPAAVAKGMLPTLGAESSLGTLTTGEVLQLIRRIRDVNAPVRVYAIAAKQTRVADRLELVFKFR